MRRGAAAKPADAGMTVEEWAALPEDQPGELVDGELVDEEVPDYLHEVVVAWLLRVLGLWLAPHGGVVAGSEAKFAVGRSRGRKPDVTAFFPNSKKPPRRGVVRVPPDIAVEVVTPTPRDARRDRVEKFEEYAAFGARFYWIVDPEVRSLEIYQLQRGHRYVRTVGATSGVVRDVSGCPGLTLDLDALWGETDRLGPSPIRSARAKPRRGRPTR